MDFAKYDDSVGLRDRGSKLKAAQNQGFTFISELVYTWLYLEGRSFIEIARLFKVSTQALYRWLAVWDFNPSGNHPRLTPSRATSFRGEPKWAHIKLATIRALWCEVLLQAVSDLRAKIDPGDPEVERRRSRAVAWFSNKEDIVCPSFIWVAELLKLDPGAVRKVVLK